MPQPLLRGCGREHVSKHQRVSTKCQEGHPWPLWGTWPLQAEDCNCRDKKFMHETNAEWWLSLKIVLAFYAAEWYFCINTRWRYLLIFVRAHCIEFESMGVNGSFSLCAFTTFFIWSSLARCGSHHRSLFNLSSRGGKRPLGRQAQVKSQGERKKQRRRHQCGCLSWITWRYLSPWHFLATWEIERTRICFDIRIFTATFTRLKKPEWELKHCKMSGSTSSLVKTEESQFCAP